MHKIYTFYIRFIPETFPWLTAKGKNKEATRMLYKMADVNKKSLPDSLKVTADQVSYQYRYQ